MNKLNQLILLLTLMLLTLSRSQAQKINFLEYDLPNGLHIILHEDHNAPVIVAFVTYNVGSKHEKPGRTGFAHFFEHLMFGGTENIKGKDIIKLGAAFGGGSNGETTQDVTSYYTMFPSNNLEAALWMESERMLHPVIDEKLVRAEAEIVKEEKRMRIDNLPYGNAPNATLGKLFVNHPYHNPVLGAMKDIDAARLDEFKAFFKEYYVPGNAVLNISGDINVPKAKQLIAAYFAHIPKGPKVAYNKIIEPSFIKARIDTAYDASIQLPGIIAAYQVPGLNNRDSKVFEMISGILSEGASSRLTKKLVNDKKTAVRVLTFNYPLADYGAYMIGVLPNQGATLESLMTDIEQEIKTLQTDLITENEHEKIKNQLELSFINANSKLLDKARNLNRGYLLYHKNTNRVNEELNEIRSITRDEIRLAARKYLNPQQQLTLYYLPGKTK